MTDAHKYSDDWRFPEQTSSDLLFQKAACLLNVSGALFTSVAVILISFKNGLDYSADVDKACSIAPWFVIGSLLGFFSIFTACIADYSEATEAGASPDEAGKEKWRRCSLALTVAAFAVFSTSAGWETLTLWETIRLVCRICGAA